MNEAANLFGAGDIVPAYEPLDRNNARTSKKWTDYSGRQYRIEQALESKPSGRTADTFLASAIWTGEIGLRPDGFPEGPLVLKVPKLDQTRYTREETVLRVARVQQKASAEIRDIAVKLTKLSHANPLIDVFTYSTEDGLVIPLTIQHRLPADHFMRLREWFADHMSTRETRWSAFPLIGLAIAHALEVIHSHRVVHGDVNPDNIFITPPDSVFESTEIRLKQDAYESIAAKFIDFGESFAADPGRHYRPRKPHPFLAPECRLSARMTEAVDVFSFGRLLLYLATGDYSSIAPDAKLRGNTHQSWIEKCLVDHGFERRSKFRCIPNLMANCLSLDPAARPRMSEVVDELRRIYRLQLGTGSPAFRCRSCADAGGERDETIKMLHEGRDTILAMINQQRKEQGHSTIVIHPLVSPILSLEIDRLAAMCTGLSRDMLEILGTREQILQALVCLFDQLDKDDSLTVATSLDMWQRDALGLGGRLGSATVRLAVRGASLRRALVVSVQELGIDYVERLIRCLRRADRSPGSPLGKLADDFERACGEYCRDAGQDVFDQNRIVPPVSDDSEKSRHLAGWLTNQDVPERKRCRWYQDRFRKLVKTVNELATDWSLEGNLFGRVPDQNELFIRTGAKAVTGVLFTLYPVGTVYQVEQIRADNPAALVNLRSKGGVEDWMLVTIDGSGTRLADPANIGRGIHLDRLRIFKSVHGVPRERMTQLSHLFSRSINIGACHGELQRALDEVAQNIETR